MEHSKKHCLHTIGIDPYSEDPLIGIESYKCEEMTHLRFNYCPWCGESIEKALTFVKNFDKEDESSDDCQKGGCAD